MTKERFLRAIQQQACRPGSNAAKAWQAAVKADENDERWHAVKEYDYVGTFASAFGVEIATPVRRKRKSPVEILEARLAKAKKTYEIVKAEKPHFAEEALAEVQRLEKRLEEARKEN